MPDDDLFATLQQVDPQLLQKMVDAGLFSERLGPEQRRMDIGQGMMNTPSAQGAQVGNTYVAASPLEHLANAFRQVAGARITQQGLQGQGALADQRGAGRLAYMKLLAQQRQPQAPGVAPPLPGAPDAGVAGY